MGKFITPESAPDGLVRFCIYCPNDDMSIWALQGQLAEFASERKWQNVFGNVAPDIMASAWQLANELSIPLDECEGTATTVPIGMIAYYPSYVTPADWFLCNGDYLYPAEYPTLYDVLGFSYGGPDGNGRFALPNLYGKFVLGTWPGTDDPGDTGGNVKINLTVGQLPPHSHTMGIEIIEDRQMAAGPRDFVRVLTSLSEMSTGSTGSGDDINIMPPYMALVPLIYTGGVGA